MLETPTVRRVGAERCRVRALNRGRVAHDLRCRRLSSMFCTERMPCSSSSDLCSVSAAKPTGGCSRASTRTANTYIHAIEALQTAAAGRIEAMIGRVVSKAIAGGARPVPTVACQPRVPSRTRPQDCLHDDGEVPDSMMRRRFWRFASG